MNPLALIWAILNIVAGIIFMIINFEEYLEMWKVCLVLKANLIGLASAVLFMTCLFVCNLLGIISLEANGSRNPFTYTQLLPFTLMLLPLFIYCETWLFQEIPIKKLGKVNGILLGSSMFGLAHGLLCFNWLTGVITFMLGLLFAVLYCKKGFNFAASAHLGYDAFLLLLLILPQVKLV